jgi:hypothetical protein
MEAHENREKPTGFIQHDKMSDIGQTSLSNSPAGIGCRGIGLVRGNGKLTHLSVSVFHNPFIPPPHLKVNQAKTQQNQPLRTNPLILNHKKSQLFAKNNFHNKINGLGT